MCVAFLGEDPSDEAVLRLFTEALLGAAVRPHEIQLAARGYASLRRNLAVVIKMLHYRSPAHSLVVLVDSDETFLAPDSDRNRLRELRDIITTTTTHLTDVPAKRRIRVALGVAAPCLEAWLLCPTDESISETTWEAGLRRPPPRYLKDTLKDRLYGPRPHVAPVKRQALMMAAKVAAQRIDLLEARFPIGFGNLAADIRAWTDR